MGFGYGGYDLGFGGSSSGFGGVEAGFAIIVLIFIGIVGVWAIKAVSTWDKNNKSPRLTVDAQIMSKRIDVTYHRHVNAGDVTGAHGYHTISSTNYYVTFQVESGDRIEFSVKGSEYGMLAEGDTGKLSFQGTRYLCFERSQAE